MGNNLWKPKSTDNTENTVMFMYFYFIKQKKAMFHAKGIFGWKLADFLVWYTL